MRMSFVTWFRYRIAAVTPRSRMLMLNSPSNPTGTVYTRAELEALADVVSGNPRGVILWRDELAA